MNFKKSILFVLIIFVLSITAVSAENITDDSPGTFDDLQMEINNAQDGSVLNLTRDYNGAYGSRVQLNKDLTIDGKGHTLDCLGHGGCSAFYSSSGNIVLKNLKIINGHNDFSDRGGAICITGSAQYTIENCIFSDNWAGDYGGAIYNDAGNTLTIRNSQFQNNEVSDEDGGAVYSKGEVILENCEFKFNYGCVRGGAVGCENNVNIYDCYFKHNVAAAATFTQCTGGAIYSKKDVYVTGSNFIDNFAYDYGGAIYAEKIFINTNQNTTEPVNTFFAENFVYDNNGGAICCEESIILNAEFRKNKALAYGGAILSYNVTLNNCKFYENKVEGSIIKSQGGAISSKYTVNIENSIFGQNYAEDGGGAIFCENVININVNQNNTQDLSCNFYSNSVKNNNGGAILCLNEVNIFNTRFSSNSAELHGGAINSDTTNIHNCYFEFNKVPEYSPNHGGGAVHATSVTVDGCTFYSNIANRNGGAIFADYVALLNHNYFKSNVAVHNGGAIYAEKFSEDIKYATFINNEANSDNGGAIYINKENHLTISQSTFINNACKEEGGAIYLDSRSSEIGLINNIFIGNNARSEGQSVYSCGYFIVVNNNYWADNNPSSSNDQLVEWKFLPWQSNVRHSDSDPLTMDLIVPQKAIPDSQAAVSIYFYKSNGDLFEGELYDLNAATFRFNPDMNITGKKVYPNYVDCWIMPENEGTYTVSVNLYGKTITKTFEVSEFLPSGNSTDNDTIPQEKYDFTFAEELITGNAENNQIDNNSTSNQTNNNVIKSISQEKGILKNNNLYFALIIIILILLAAYGVKKYKKE